MKLSLSKNTNSKNYFPGVVPCSSTLNFFEPTPVFIHECVPGSTFHIDIKNYIRTSVLNLPTYGDYKVLTKSVFVPFGDVYKPWDAFMSGTSYYGTSKFIPTRVPVLNPAEVLGALVNTVGYGSTNTISILNAYDASGNIIIPTSSDKTAFADACNNYFKIPPTWASNYDVTLPESSTARRNSKDFYLGELPASAFTSGTSSSVVDKYKSASIYISFSEQAKVLHRVLVALSIPITNDSTVHSALPLLCYTKAVYDLFSPNRTDSENIPFEATPLYGIIYSCMGTDPYILTLSNIKSLFQMILDNTYYINNDFYSIFRKNVAVTQSESVRFPSTTSVGADNSFTQSVSAGVGETQWGFNNSSQVTSDRLNAIFRIGRLIKQNTALGGKLREFMRSRFGASPSDPHDLFEINSFLSDIDISDIFATASTSGSDGSVLGEYGGRALGRGSSSFSFSTDKAGLFFVISVAIQNRYWFQGVNPVIHRISKNDFYQPVFDSLGYEIAPYSYFTQSEHQLTVNQDSSFAYIPRYSNYKFFKPVVNGDFARYSVRDSLLAFIGSAYNTLPRNERFAFTMEINKPAFFPVLYNTNHIFYDSEEQRTAWQYDGPDVDCVYPAVDDPLILHSYIKIDMHAPMIGRSDSFETNTGDKPTINVEY